MSDQARRTDWVDAAKGICIIMVVMMHSTLGVEREAGATGWMGDIVAFAKPFRMPDFFLISGLFLDRVINKDWRTFIDRRVIHFFYFYVIWLTFQFAIKAPGMILSDGLAATAGNYVLSLFVEPFGTLWFIWLLPFFALTVRLTRPLPAILVLAVAAGLEIAPIETGWTAIDEFAARFVYFYLGYLLAPVVFAIAADVRAAPKTALMALAVWAGINGSAVLLGWASLPGVSLPLGVMGALAIVSMATLANRLALIGPMLRYYGENSIVVYLGFFLPMAVMRQILISFGCECNIGFMSLIVTVFAATVPFIMRRVADSSGFGFMYERPAWARLVPARDETRSGSKSMLTPSGLAAAE